MSNKIIHILGNLTRDPELRVTQNGTAICNYSVAVNSTARKRLPDGTYSFEKTTDYFRVTVYGSDAENCGKFLKKGRKVYIYGEPTINVARDANGKVIYKKDVNGNVTDEPLLNLEIHCNAPRTEFLSNPVNGTEPGAPAAGTQPAAEAAAVAPTVPGGVIPVDVPEDELPF